MKTVFSHINIISNNARKLSTFYEQVFCCTPLPPERDLSGEWVDRLTGVPGARIRGIHLLLPDQSESTSMQKSSRNTTLEILEYQTNGKPNQKLPQSEGFGHIAFLVEDIEACVEEIIRHGGSLVGEITEACIPDVGTFLLVYAKDPEGNIVELQQL